MYSINQGGRESYNLIYLVLGLVFAVGLSVIFTISGGHRGGVLYAFGIGELYHYRKSAIISVIATIVTCVRLILIGL